MNMRADKLLLFFITVISSFCATAAGYTGDARGAATSRGGSALIVHDALTGHSGSLTAVSPPGIHTISGSRNDQGDHTSEVYKILSVLEGRIEDPKLIQKVKDKLSTLKGDRLRMVVSLSERITDGNHGAETDIAFFLLTTLIIFS
jgi:hypothetical protein